MANNWAIVIGINHYDHHPERQLKYAVPDAQLMYGFLCTHAGFDRDRILLCLGDQDYKTSPTYPTYSTLLRLLNRDLHPDRVGQVDRLWFFFGGHGVSQNGRDYLLTSDSLLEDIELKIALPIDEVIASLRRHQLADIVLILDNCRQQQGSRQFVVDDIGKQTIELAQSRGITTIFSCDYGQFSYELESLKQGAFTYALVEGLKQYTLPDKLEPYLRHRVAQLNQRSDQIPRIRVEPAAKALQPLLPSAVTAEDITVLVDRAREAELEENFEAAKQLWWQVIEVAQSGDRIREARMAIDRIDQKIERLRGDRSTSSMPMSERKGNNRSTESPPQPAIPAQPSSAKAPVNPTVQFPKNTSERSFSATPTPIARPSQTSVSNSESPSFGAVLAGLGVTLVVVGGAVSGMNGIAWVIVGSISGAIAKAYRPGYRGGGILTTVFLGIMGAFIGGSLHNLLSTGTLALTATGLSIGGLFVSIIGALIALFLWGLLTRRS